MKNENKETQISLAQIGLYSPQRQSSEVTEKLFVVRQKQFEMLIKNITQEKENSIPQHYLIIGQRGMGKTTMLKRIEVELHKRKYSKQFIPLLFPEEQYNLKDLAVFWLNCLDALADSLELEGKEKNRDKISDIDNTILDLQKNTPEIIQDKAYKYLMHICRDLDRRPVLLIDNIGLVFNRLDNIENKQAQWALRKLLSENGAPIVISAGVTAINDVINYKMPFYDFFQIEYLKKLTFVEYTGLLENLSGCTKINDDIKPLMRKEKPRLETLYQFTGGNPRTAVMLFKLLIKGFSEVINDDLDALVDEVTPLYKAKFEELPQQQQIIIDAIAMNWNAVSLKGISTITHFENNQLSPQLKRLVDEGWIETTPAYKTKGNAYYISERFFNIWFLIRRSNRRQKKGVHCLAEFLECLYGTERMIQEADRFLRQEIMGHQQIIHGLSFAQSKYLDIERKNRLKEKTYSAILNLSEKDKEILEQYDIPNKFLIEKIPALHINKIKELTTRIKLKDVEFWINIGDELFTNKKYEESIICYDKAIELKPKDPFTWNSKGFSLKYLQRHNESIICCDNAIELEPELSVFWVSKGLSLADLQRYEEAIVCYDKAIDLEPEYSSYWKSKGNTLYNLQRYEEAIVCFDKAIELEPEYFLAWMDKGDTLADLQRYEEAIICFDKAIQLDPESSFAWYDKGSILIDLQRYEEAITCFDKAIQLDPRRSNSWNNKGCALIDLQRYEEAIACFEKAIELDPVNTSAWSNKGYTLIELKDYETALDAYNESMRIAPKDLICKFHLLFLYRDKLDETNKAMDIFKTMDENKIPKEFVCRYHLQKTLFELYKQNQGVATEYLNQAFEVLEKENKLSSMASEYWLVRFGYVVIKIGYGSWLLDILKEKSYDIILSPYYTAIKALELETQDKKKGEEDAEIYLKNIAIEISSPARKIIEKIRKYM